MPITKLRTPATCRFGGVGEGEPGRREGKPVKTERRHTSLDGLCAKAESLRLAHPASDCSTDSSRERQREMKRETRIPCRAFSKLSEIKP